MGCSESEGFSDGERGMGFEGRSERCSGVKGFKEGRFFLGKRSSFREGDMGVSMQGVLGRKNCVFVIQEILRR